MGATLSVQSKDSLPCNVYHIHSLFICSHAVFKSANNIAASDDGHNKSDYDMEVGMMMMIINETENDR